MSLWKVISFGKAFAAKMLCAYYDKNCDSRALFEGLQMSQMDSFEKYLNRLAGGYQLR